MTVGGYIEPQLIRQEHHSCLQVLGAKAMTNHVVHFLNRGWAVEVLVLAVEIACFNISLEGGTASHTFLYCKQVIGNTGQWTMRLTDQNSLCSHLVRTLGDVFPVEKSSWYVLISHAKHRPHSSVWYPTMSAFHLLSLLLGSLLSLISLALRALRETISPFQSLSSYFIGTCGTWTTATG